MHKSPENWIGSLRNSMSPGEAARDAARHGIGFVVVIALYFMVRTSYGYSMQYDEDSELDIYAALSERATLSTYALISLFSATMYAYLFYEPKPQYHIRRMFDEVIIVKYAYQIGRTQEPIKHNVFLQWRDEFSALTRHLMHHHPERAADLLCAVAEYYKPEPIMIENQSQDEQQETVLQDVSDSDNDEEEHLQQKPVDLLVDLNDFENDDQPFVVLPQENANNEDEGQVKKMLRRLKPHDDPTKFNLKDYVLNEVEAAQPTKYRDVRLGALFHSMFMEDEIQGVPISFRRPAKIDATVEVKPTFTDLDTEMGGVRRSQFLTPTDDKHQNRYPQKGKNAILFNPKSNEFAFGEGKTCADLFIIILREIALALGNHFENETESWSTYFARKIPYVRDAISETGLTAILKCLLADDLFKQHSKFPVEKQAIILIALLSSMDKAYICCCYSLRPKAKQAFLKLSIENQVKILNILLNWDVALFEEDANDLKRKATTLVLGAYSVAKLLIETLKENKRFDVVKKEFCEEHRDWKAKFLQIANNSSVRSIRGEWMEISLDSMRFFPSSKPESSERTSLIQQMPVYENNL